MSSISANDLILTDSERTAIEELGRRVSGAFNLNYYDETHLFYRFLKARDWDVNKAEGMFRQWLKWRKENNIDTILEDYKPPEVLQKYLANIKIGHAKDGCEIYYVPIGKYDVVGFLNSAKYSDIEKSTILIFEACEHYVEEEGKRIDLLLISSQPGVDWFAMSQLQKKIPGYVSILDLLGLTFANATNKKGIETFIRLLLMQQNYFPGRIETTYLINAPAIFTIPFSIVNNFIDPGLRDKFKLYGSEGWQEEILKAIDADQLPVFLGGTRMDPDGNPNCTTFVNQGGKIDEKYNIQKSKSSLANSPGVKKLVLSRASFTEIDLEVKEMGSLIEWEFETKVRDIGFGLFYKGMDGEEEKITELVSLQRLETQEFSETGMYKCEMAGNYVILFDNSYSWVRSKEIFYRVTVVSPKEHEKNMHL